MIEEIEAIYGVLKVVPCGSKFVCDPPVMTTDEDYLVFAVNKIHAELEALGYASDSDNTQPSSRPTVEDDVDWRFESWRRGSINLIVTTAEEFAKKHEAATRVCKKLNLLDKRDRIMIYQAVLYGAFKE